MVAKIKPPPIYRVTLIQGIFVALVALLLLFKSEVYALSAVVGGLICIVPSTFFARFAFKYSGAKHSMKVARSFYLGEAGKFVLTTVLFAAVFIAKLDVNIAVLFLFYGLTVIVGFVSATRIIGR